MNQQKERQVLEYLDDLRASGVVNMFGATPYLVRDMELTKKDATKALINWMKTFSTRHPD